MPTITDIKQLKRSKDHFSVYVDGKYSFSIRDLELSASNLVVGQELSADEVVALQDQGGEDKAINLAVKYVATRPRSRKEIQDYLNRKGFQLELAAGVMSRLEELGLADDRSFAKAWVENRQTLRPRSRRKLEQELMAKGLSRDDISAVLEVALSSRPEIESLLTVIAKKRRLPQYQDPNKLMAYLLRQGYTYDLVKEALDSSNSPDGL